MDLRLTSVEKKKMCLLVSGICLMYSARRPPISLERSGEVRCSRAGCIRFVLIVVI